LSTVSNNVLRDVKNLPLNDDKHAVTETSNRSVTASVRSCVDDADQPSSSAHLPLVDETAETVGNTASDGASSLHRNSGIVPVLHSNITLTKPLMMPKLQLLPPTAFMSRTDGTPILTTETEHGAMWCVSAFEKREKSTQGDEDGLAAKVPCGHRTKDVEEDMTSDGGGQSENVADTAAELLFIRQTLRTFAENKEKLKYVVCSL